MVRAAFNAFRVFGTTHPEEIGQYAQLHQLNFVEAQPLDPCTDQ
jgi:hypothetical protein